MASSGGESTANSVDADARKSLIVYGNCQADNITGLLQELEPIAAHYRVSQLSTVPGYDPPSPATLDDIATCDVLLEQFEMGAEFQHADLVPRDAARVSFPSTDLHLLWPFTLTTNPFNVRRPPAAPYGPFPYGDRVIVGMVEAGAGVDEILAFYLQRWDDYGPDMDKMMRLERGRLGFRDGKCDMQIAEYIFDNFRTSRLFFTVNHPTALLLGELVARLVLHCDRLAPLCDEATLRRDLDRLAEKYPYGPRGSSINPVHPRIAERYELAWFDPAEQYPIPGQGYKTYEDYLRTMIAESIAVKQEREEQKAAGEPV